MKKKQPPQPVALITGSAGGLGACLADDMGLGKTVQVIALLLARQKEVKTPALLVVPASLVGNWRAEVKRFAPDLKLFIAHPTATSREGLDWAVKHTVDALRGCDVMLTTYQFLQRTEAWQVHPWSMVILDEAQAMPIESLEALRLLTNLETEKRKLLQVVLFGQPELDDKLAEDSVRQLRQRITFQYRLGELGRAELDYYLAHRLRVAGYRGNRLITKPAVRALHRASGGTPRLVNVLAHKSLLLAFGEGAQQVTPHHVRAATNDTPSARQQSWWWLGFAMLVVSAGGIGWMMMYR